MKGYAKVLVFSERYELNNREVSIAQLIFFF